MGNLIDETFAKQILSDLDRIKETLQEIQSSGNVEKKEQRKLIDIVHMYLKHEDKCQGIIDAVVQCYEKWLEFPAKPFPEYLKETLL